MAGDAAELARVADDLYGLPVEEFTGARNERAQQFRARGDKQLAAAVGKLAKPSTAAWVGNMLVRRHPDEVDQLIELGEGLRQAQENLDGEELRELTRQRHRVVMAVARQARTLAHDLGRPVSESIAGQVEDMLRAAMADPAAGSALRTGRLVSAFAPAGLDEIDLSGVVAVPSDVPVAAGRAPARAPAARPQPSSGRAAGEKAAGGKRQPGAQERREQEQREQEQREQERRERERREQELAAARRAAETARRTAEEAETDAAQAEERVGEVTAGRERGRERMAELERELQRARRDVDAAAEELRDTRRERDAARRTAETARRAADRAAAKVERLS